MEQLQVSGVQCQPLHSDPSGGVHLAQQQHTAIGSDIVALVMVSTTHRLRA